MQKTKHLDFVGLSTGAKGNEQKESRELWMLCLAILHAYEETKQL